VVFGVLRHRERVSESCVSRAFSGRHDLDATDAGNGPGERWTRRRAADIKLEWKPDIAFASDRRCEPH
jgi:hypothetical protein